MQNHEPDIFAAATRHDLAYWTDHPDVANVLATEGQGDELTLRIWLKRRTEAEMDAILDALVARDRSKKLQRPADIEFGGDGPLHLMFWPRCPRLEYYEQLEDFEADEFSDGWWAALLWLAPENASIAA